MGTSLEGRLFMVDVAQVLKAKPDCLIGYH